MKRSVHASPYPGRADQRLPTLVCIDSPAAVAPRLRMLIGFESVKWQLRERTADRRPYLPVARNVQD